MNFFKALFTINSLRKEVEHLRTEVLDSSMYNLQLVSQVEQQRREIQSLHDKLNGNATPAATMKPARATPAATMKPARKYYKRKPKTTQQ